jgi:glycosyltransferase involved in cell wall biosynthesis
MRVLFIGPRLLAGIGQVTNRYASLIRAQGHEAEFLELGQSPQHDSYDAGFAFVLPIVENLNFIDRVMTMCRKKVYMTICETEPVNPVYGILEKYKTLWVASEFCKSVFERQFPQVEWKVLPLWAPAPSLTFEPAPPTPYVFYTIGNILDARKNIKSLIEAYLRCGFGNDAHLVLKATCVQPVEWRVPGVSIINGLISDEDMEKVHGASHCYINCSHSEGVGMGAVEAALRSKPVIISEYGGLKEYVKTPWVVSCTKGPIGFDDFLFKKEHEWGHPSLEDLMTHLKDCFEKRVVTWDHTHTKELMSTVPSCLSYCLC